MEIGCKVTIFNTNGKTFLPFYFHFSTGNQAICIINAKIRLYEPSNIVNKSQSLRRFSQKALVEALFQLLLRHKAH